MVFDILNFNDFDLDLSFHYDGDRVVLDADNFVQYEIYMEINIYFHCVITIYDHYLQCKDLLFVIN